MSALRLGRHRDLLPGQVVIVGCVTTAVVAVLSIRATETLGWMFALGFVLICLTLPLAADHRALLTCAVLPPLLVLATAAGIAVFAPHSIDIPGLAETAGTLQRTIAGFVAQATPLAIGFCLSLAAIGFRISTHKAQTAAT